VVAALGPRTRRLAAEIADGVLLTWLPPRQARAAIAGLRADAAGRTAGATSPVGILYARAIADHDARPALEAEASRYAGSPAYASNFSRLGIAPIDATIDLTAPAGAPGNRGALEGEVDELVLRVITRDATEEQILRVIEAGAPPLIRT
jgi:alkanesulfonate monooxygenase SsuD/methylene tetrahydromethanopterin reductase-like flavin-dependent oxidoreductase (luciferase family)